MLGGKSTYADQKRIEEPCFLIRSLALRQYGNQLVADNAYYRPPQENRPGGYLLDGVREPKNLGTRPSLSLDGEAVLITPHDAPDWLKPNQCFLRSGVDFDLLTRDGAKAFKQLSSTRQLVRALRNPSLDYGADVRVAIHGRIVKPLLDLTLLFLGLPLVVTRENRNVFIAIGLCMLVTFAFTVTVIGLQMLGEASWFAQPGTGRLGSLDDLRALGGWDGRVALEMRPAGTRRVRRSRRDLHGCACYCGGATLTG